MTTQQQESIPFFSAAKNHKTQNILKGINLILRHQPCAEIQAWEDVGISCGICTEGINKVTGMTQEVEEQLREWGWHGHAGKWRTWTRMDGQR